MQKTGAFEVLTKDSAVDTLYGAIQRAVAAVQPVLILEETPSPKEPLAESKPLDNPVDNPASIARVDERTEDLKINSNVERKACVGSPPSVQTLFAQTKAEKVSAA
jgi:hypothetical protein